MRSGRRSSVAISVVAGLSLALLAGCTGGGNVYVMPLFRQDFAPGDQPVVTVPLTEGFYWTDEDGTLNLALRHEGKSILGEMFDSEWQLSMVLAGLPAGRERLYRLGSREIRTLQSQGPDHRRSRSANGVVVIEGEQHGTIKGRFHAWVREQRFSPLTGWAPPIGRAPVKLMAGEFQAVRDPDRGAAILVRTEAEGFERPPPGSPDAKPMRHIPLPPASRPGP